MRDEKKNGIVKWNVEQCKCTMCMYKEIEKKRIMSRHETNEPNYEFEKRYWTIGPNVKSLEWLKWPIRMNRYLQI